MHSSPIFYRLLKAYATCKRRSRSLILFLLTILVGFMDCIVPCCSNNFVLSAFHLACFFKVLIFDLKSIDLSHYLFLCLYHLIFSLLHFLSQFNYHSFLLSQLRSNTRNHHLFSRFNYWFRLICCLMFYFEVHILFYNTFCCNLFLGGKLKFTLI